MKKSFDSILVMLLVIIQFMISINPIYASANQNDKNSDYIFEQINIESEEVVEDRSNSEGIENNKEENMAEEVIGDNSKSEELEIKQEKEELIEDEKEDNGNNEEFEIQQEEENLEDKTEDNSNNEEFEIQQEEENLEDKTEDNSNAEESEIKQEESMEGEVTEDQSNNEEGSKGNDIEGPANSWRYFNGEKMILDKSDEERAISNKNAWTKVDGFYINSRGEIIEGALSKGIDVSEWQGIIDWDTVKKTDIEYAIIRCGYGMNQENQDDKYWERNAAECTRLGIPFGAYLYSYADSVEKAESEARHVLRLIKNYKLEYPIYYDLEENSVRQKLSTSEIAKIAKTFCDIISEAGYNVAIYANTDWFSNYLIDPFFDTVEKWVAQYNSTCTYTGNYTMWQCTDIGNVKGINGNVDINMDFGTIKKYRVLLQGGKYYGYFGGDKLYGEQKVDGAWYYFDMNCKGAATIGWREVGKNKYYYGTDGKLVLGETKIGSSWYYFRGNGTMLTGWREVGKNKYYYGTDGKLALGETKIGSSWYYFRGNGIMLTGWREVGKNKYYYGTDGKLALGETKIGSSWYYFRGNGTMLTGWREADKNKYYYNEDGTLTFGTKKINGNWYAFSKRNGQMVVNSWYEGKYYGKDGIRVES